MGRPQGKPSRFTFSSGTQLDRRGGLLVTLGLGLFSCHDKSSFLTISYAHFTVLFYTLVHFFKTLQRTHFSFVRSDSLYWYYKEKPACLSKIYKVNKFFPQQVCVSLAKLFQRNLKENVLGSADWLLDWQAIMHLMSPVFHILHRGCCTNTPGLGGLCKVWTKIVKWCSSSLKWSNPTD